VLTGGEELGRRACQDASSRCVDGRRWRPLAVRAAGGAEECGGGEKIRITNVRWSLE
jgi:hypothetical protein